MNMKNLVFFIAAFVSFAKFSYGVDAWQEYHTSHFLIYYKDAPRDFVKNVEKAAEADYEEITRNLGFYRDQSWSWEKRAKIYIYRDSQDYTASAKQASWTHGVADWLKKEIRAYPSTAGFFDSLLPHELGHIIFREFVGSNPFVPLWFDEGVAVCQEKARGWGSNNEVKRAIEEKKFIPLRELSSMRLYNNTEKDMINLFYAEAASIVYYLIVELGEFKFIDFCRKLKEGERFEAALNATYVQFKNLDDLNNAWVEHLKR